MAAIPSSEIQGQPRDATTQGALLPRGQVINAPRTPSQGNEPALGSQEDRVELDALPETTTQTTTETPGLVSLEVEAPVVAAEAADLDTSSPYTYDPTGDTSLDYALAFIGDKGYGPNHPAVQEARKGNFDLLSAELAQKGVAGADAVLKLARDAHARITAAAEAKTKALGTYAAQVAGGEQNWNTVRNWASKNLDAASKAQVNAALDTGGLTAEAMIDRLVRMVSSKITLTKRPANPVNPNAGASGSPNQDTSALSAAEYKAGLAQLRTLAKGKPIEGSDQYKALSARRLAGISQGI